MLCGMRVDEHVPGATNRLYKNNRDGTFTDVTEKAGLVRTGWASGVTVGDYNNDGFEDIFITYYGQNVLYRNNGDGTFTDVTRQAGLLYEGNTRWGSGCTFLDYNRDGYLDLFVANYVDLIWNGFRSRGRILTAISRVSGQLRSARPGYAAQLSVSEPGRRNISRCLRGKRYAKASGPTR